MEYTGFYDYLSQNIMKTKTFMKAEHNNITLYFFPP